MEVSSFTTMLHGYESGIVAYGAEERLPAVTHSEHDVASQKRYCMLPTPDSKSSR